MLQCYNAINLEGWTQVDLTPKFTGAWAEPMNWHELELLACLANWLKNLALN